MTQDNPSPQDEHDTKQSAQSPSAEVKNTEAHEPAEPAEPAAEPAAEPVSAWRRALQLIKKLTPLLELDLRALALFRILFGLLCVGDLISRVPHIELMYASTGWLPNADVISKLPHGQPHALSLLHMLNTPEAIFGFFVLSWVALAFFIVGYRTKTAQLISMICMLSLHNRNDLFQNGGDVAHNLWWMWTITLPLGARWSVDALIKSWRRPDTSDELLNAPPQDGGEYHLSLAALGLLLNLSVCYFLNAVHKTGATWISGDAVAYTLEQDRILFSLGEWVRHTLPNWMLKGLSWGTLVAEGGAFLFFLSPWRTTQMRRIIMLALGGFHLGVAWTVQIGFFSYWMLSPYLALLRREDMNALARLFKPRRPQLVMFYDSDCGVCHATARLIARLDPYRKLTWVGRAHVIDRPGALSEEAFLSLREETLIAWNPESGELWTHHKAVAQALRSVPFLWPFGWLLWLTGRLGRAAYERFAARRHLVSAWLGYGLCGLRPAGLAAPAALPAQEGGVSRLWRSITRSAGELYIILAMVTMFYAVLHHNRLFKKWSGKPNPPSWVRSWIHYGQMRQSWRLFSPEAPVKDGWMVLVAKLSDGRELDVRTGLPPDFSQAHYTRRTWDLYEARVDFKLLTRKHLWAPFVSWMKRPTNRFRLTPKDRVVELTYYWVGDTTSKPRSDRVNPPKSQPRKLVYHWSLKEERAARRAKRLEELKKTKQTQKTSR